MVKADIASSGPSASSSRCWQTITAETSAASSACLGTFGQAARADDGYVVVRLVLLRIIAKPPTFTEKSQPHFHGR